MALPTNIEQKVFALIDYFHRKKYLAYIEELERKDAFKEKRTRSIEKRARVKTTAIIKEAEARNSQKEKLWPKKRQIRC